MARKSTGKPLKKETLASILPTPKKKSVNISSGLHAKVEEINKEIARLELLRNSYLEGVAFQNGLKAPFLANDNFKTISES